MHRTVLLQPALLFFVTSSDILLHKYVLTPSSMKTKTDSLRAVSSGSSLFAILFLIYNGNPFGSNGSVQMQRWKSLFQKLMH